MKANAWLARDDDHDDDKYVICTGDKPVRDEGRWVTLNGGCFVCDMTPHAMETTFLDVPHLAPGEGPIPVAISIERAE